MSAPIDNGGAAFPGQNFTQGGQPNGHNMGLSMRDWFAGQALSGIAANSGWCDMLMAPGMAEANAKAAYAYADAMIAARQGASA